MQFKGTPQQWRKVVEGVESLPKPICWSRDQSGEFRAETTDHRVSIDWWPSTGTVTTITVGLSYQERSNLLNTLVHNINNAVFETEP